VNEPAFVPAGLLEPERFGSKIGGDCLSPNPGEENQEMNSQISKRNAAPTKYRLLRSVLAAVLCCAGAAAQSDPGAKTPSVEDLIKKIGELETAQRLMQEKLDKLTGVVPAPPIAPVPPPAAPPEVAQAVVAEPVGEPSDGHTLGPVQFRGFSDFNVGNAWFEKQPPGGLNGTPRSFTIGDLDLFTNTRISDHWSVLGELLITSDFSNEFGAELDRLMFTYKHNDYLKVSFGKFNTALGYYGNAFHRAQYFQTAIGRPIMYSDEDNGGILPTHSVGVTATGKIPSGSMGLAWVAEVSNGRSASNPEVPIQNFVDENNGKAVNFAVYARPEWAHGLQSGFSMYRDTMHPVDMGDINQTILTAHIAYIGSRLEWLNEASMVRHAVPADNKVFRAYTSYTQLGWLFGKTRPYVRFDYQNVAADDPVLGHLGRQSGLSFGVTRHISNYVALKLQYGRLARSEHASTNVLTGQLAFAF
jgi:hypothetical protein